MGLSGTKLTRKQELELPTYQAFLDRGFLAFTSRLGNEYYVELSFGKIYIVGANGRVFKDIGEFSPENYEKVLSVVKDLY